MPYRTGSCMCGIVSYRVKDDFKRFFLCHCTQCQKATGSAHASNLFTALENLEWLSGVDKIKRYDVPNRSLSKAFCTECGSGLPYQSKASDNWVVPAGSLKENPSITPTANIFWHERPSWYDAAIKAPQCEGFYKL